MRIPIWKGVRPLSNARVSERDGGRLALSSRIGGNNDKTNHSGGTGGWRAHDEPGLGANATQPHATANRQGGSNAAVSRDRGWPYDFSRQLPAANGTDADRFRWHTIDARRHGPRPHRGQEGLHRSRRELQQARAAVAIRPRVLDLRAVGDHA